MKIIPKFPDYAIDADTAQVYSFKRKRYLKPGLCKGYAIYSLMKDGRKVMKRRARLVFETFKGTIRKGNTIDHLNGIKTDDSISNLDQCTIGENVRRFWRKQV